MTSAGDLTFEYDLENRRIQKQGGSQTTTYFQNPNAPLPQVLMKTTGGTTTYYIYGLGLIAEETGSSFKTYHYDYRGSTIALTDSNGLVSDTYDYGPYGELLSHTGTSQVDYLYNGRDGVITDTEDLYYMRARYYSTDLRRFLSEDAFVGKYDDLLGLNLYGYVNGNPVQLVDPSGYDPEDLRERNISIDPGTVVGLMELSTPIWIVTAIARAKGADLQVNPYLQAIDDGFAIYNIGKGIFEFTVKNGDSLVRFFTKNGTGLVLKGINYSAEYIQKLISTYKVFQDNGYQIGEHGLNRIFGRINQGKIKSLDQVFDVLKTGTKYSDTVEGGTVIFKNGVSIHIAEDGFIKSVIGEAKVKTTWEIIK